MPPCLLLTHGTEIRGGGAQSPHPHIHTCTHPSWEQVPAICQYWKALVACSRFFQPTYMAAFLCQRCGYAWISSRNRPLGWKTLSAWPKPHWHPWKIPLISFIDPDYNQVVGCTLARKCMVEVKEALHRMKPLKWIWTLFTQVLFNCLTPLWIFHATLCGKQTYHSIGSASSWVIHGFICFISLLILLCATLRAGRKYILSWNLRAEMAPALSVRRKEASSMKNDFDEVNRPQTKQRGWLFMNK